MHAPRVGHPCEEFWIGGSALPSHKSRAGNNRRDKRGSTG